MVEPIKEGKVKKGGLDDPLKIPRSDPPKDINSDKGVATKPEPTGKAPNKRLKNKKRKKKKKVMSSLKRIIDTNLTGVKIELDKVMFHVMLESDNMIGIDLGDGTTIVFWVSDAGEISRVRNGDLEDMKRISQEEKKDDGSEESTRE
jgi:hypothetical protein